MIVEILKEIKQDTNIIKIFCDGKLILDVESTCCIFSQIPGIIKMMYNLGRSGEEIVFVEN